MRTSHRRPHYICRSPSVSLSVVSRMKGHTNFKGQRSRSLCKAQTQTGCIWRKEVDWRSSLMEVKLLSAVGDRQLQLPSVGCGRSVLYSRRPQLRDGGCDEAAPRGVPTGRLRHQRRHSRHQDVLHTGRRRRHIHQLRRRRHPAQRRLILRR